MRAPLAAHTIDPSLFREGFGGNKGNKVHACSHDFRHMALSAQIMMHAQ